MGWLSRLMSNGRARDETVLDALLIEGDDTSVEVVGESHYLPALQAISGRHGMERVRHAVTAALVREPSNPYDDQAVAVWIEGERVGYLSRTDARAYQDVLLALGSRGKVLACNAKICGREDTPNLGVWLELPVPDVVWTACGYE